MHITLRVPQFEMAHGDSRMMVDEVDNGQDGISKLFDSSLEPHDPVFDYGPWLNHRDILVLSG